MKREKEEAKMSFNCKMRIFQHKDDNHLAIWVGPQYCSLHDTVAIMGGHKLSNVTAYNLRMLHFKDYGWESEHLSNLCWRSCLPRC
mmetsp:Transcript_33703/g.43058  ORF Transcript_33703/g.43058 Transcript_33703/m.43058 type:complete len:86 (-) Transcript_33703:193-450(-)